MKILYHHRTQGEEPESIHIAAIVSALQSLGHEVRVVGPKPLAHGPRQEQRPTLAGRVKRALPGWMFEWVQVAYNVVVYARLMRATKDFRPDMIYERYALFTLGGVLAARRAGVPLVLEVNTPYAQAWARYYGLAMKGLARAMERRILTMAGHVITVSGVQKGMLAAEGLPASRITVCHNAIDPDWFSPARHHDPGWRARLGLTGTVVGFVGTMNRWQGMDKFPVMMREVLATVPDASFLLVGDGEFRRPLEEFCRREGLTDRVVFTGRQPHQAVPALVAAMDIAILLDSNHYGSPMKLFEYLAMGKAVVAPSVAPVREVLQHRVTGLMIPPGDAEAMAAAVIALARDAGLRARLGAAGREMVVARHTWRQNARAIEAAYDGLARREPGAVLAGAAE